MAAIENRSRYSVTVKNRPDLTREFPHDRQADARAYLKALRSEGYKPVVAQGTDNLWVRFRRKGHKRMAVPASSYDEAEQIIQRIESEWHVGLFVDYRQGHVVTGAQLMQQYLETEVPKHKGKDVERYTINGWIEDSTGELQKRRQAHAEALSRGEQPKAVRARREPRRALEWLQKPFAQILPTDIEAFVVERLEDCIAPATIDRELDLFSQVCRWAISVRRIHVHQSPMDGVRRPRYFNQRNRVLSADELDRLLASAREEDRQRSLQIAVETELTAARESAASLPNASAKKRHIAAARSAAVEKIGDSFAYVPLYEALITLLLMTTMRRGEALKLKWGLLRLDEQEGTLLDTKNGTNRTTPFRSEVVELLQRLPSDQEHVFPITVDALKGAWHRICSRAKLVDLHIHDLRHSGLTYVVQVAFEQGQPFGLPELQAVSGHRDLASLSRYTHMCAGSIARKLDALFATSKERDRLHKGRLRTWAPRSPARLTPADLADDELTPPHNTLPA